MKSRDKTICLDIETTGLERSVDEILQLTIIDYNENILINEYIKPRNKTQWFGAQMINGITPEDVKNKKNITYYKKEIIDIINGADIIIGFNHKSFDIPIIERELGIEIDRNKCIDVMPLYVREYTMGISNGRIKLSEACNDLGIEIDNYHNALDDALATLKVYKEVINNKNKKHKRFNKELVIYRYLKDEISKQEVFENISDVAFQHINKTYYKQECKNYGDLYNGIRYFWDKIDCLNELYDLECDYLLGIGIDERNAYELLRIHKKKPYMKIDDLILLSYNDLCDALKRKYGEIQEPYFKNEKCDVKNQNIIKKGLVIHHIKENEAIFLSKPLSAKINPYEYQKGYNLVYCNMIEHLLLHVKIVIETKEKYGYNGMELINKSLKDVYENGFDPSKVSMSLQVYNEIKDKEDDYKKILNEYGKLL